MKTVISVLALTSGVMAMAQTPADRRTFTHPLGFSYAIPGDWEVVDSNAGLNDAKQQAKETAKSEEEKKGVGCVEVGLTARHEGSVIVEVAMPFDCYGQSFTDAELPSFGKGVAEGIQSSFTVNEPVTTRYTLGTHHLWIERTKGTPKNDSTHQYTVEIACGLMKKAAVCWMTMAADDGALTIFEQGAVTLEDDAPAALVPVTAFAAKPM